MGNTLSTSSTPLPEGVDPLVLPDGPGSGALPNPAAMATGPTPAPFSRRTLSRWQARFLDSRFELVLPSAAAPSESPGRSPSS